MDEIIMIPCPFCAGPPVLIYQWLDKDGRWGSAIPVPIESHDGHYLKVWVFCHECGCDGPVADDICCDQEEFEELKKQALDNWNRRDERHKELYTVNLAEGRSRYPRTDLADSREGVR
jgi:hypothetical protein